MPSWSARRRTVLVVLLTSAALVGCAVVLVSQGVIWPTRILADDYDVRGVDVSSHQGDISWPTLARQDIDFAYVKATEGSSFVDERFADNLREARAAGLLVGAYHFFSFESPGRTQAENIVATVPSDDGLLPVAVDLELYGTFVAHSPDPETVRAELDDLLDALRAHYGVDPVIYATTTAYDRYLADRYPDNPIWIRSVFGPPRMRDDRPWTFWQYSHRERLDGYQGRERFVDMNVFDGNLLDLRSLAGQ